MSPFRVTHLFEAWDDDDRPLGVTTEVAHVADFSDIAGTVERMVEQPATAGRTVALTVVWTDEEPA